MLPLLLAALLSVPAAADPAPDFHLSAVQNAPVRKLAGLKDLKGKVVFLEFWATWCEPCVQGIPRSNRLMEALKGEPVVFLSVTDEDADAVAAFREKHEMGAWVGVDGDGSAFRAYHARSRPSGFLIGKDGTLLASVFPDELTEKDVRDAVAGRFAARPVTWDDGPGPSGAGGPGGEVYLEARVSAASGEPGMEFGPDGFSATSLPFSEAVATIWDVESGQVSVDSAPVAALDFTLKSSPDRLEEGRRVLQDAVRAAFGVKVTREARKTDALALTLIPGATARPKAVPAGERVALTRYGGGRLLGSGPMPRIARVLWSALHTPVLDETGLKGAYAFDLEWTRGDRKALEALLAEQGLRLAPVRRPVEFVVVTKGGN